MTVPAIIGGGLGLLGGALSSSANRREAQRNRDFQERMRATQYQTAVADMRAAGLNPALAYDQGGAGTPSGSTMDVSQLGEGVAESLPKALQAASAKATLGVIKANEELTRERSSQVRTETAKTEADRQFVLSQKRRYDRYTGEDPNTGELRDDSAFAADMRRARAMANATEYSLSEAAAASEFWKKISSSGKWAQMVVPWMLQAWRNSR